MRFCRWSTVVCLLILALPAFSTVTVSAPTNGATTTSPVHFVATGSSPACSRGVGAMGIYTAPNVLAYKVNGSKLDTQLTLSSGTYNIVVKQWDNCGWSAGANVALTVSGSTSKAIVFSDLQSKSGWDGYALLPPLYPLCSKCVSTGPELKWSWTQNVSPPSMDGLTTKSVYGGGTVQWSDAFWNVHLIGNMSSQGMKDASHTIIPNLHHFTYDVYFWVKDVSVSQALEFDINQFVGGKSYIWGHECRVAGGHEWDTWNNIKKHWVPSGIPCNPISNAWNHLVLDVYRTPGGKLQFHSITLNGKTAVLDRYDDPTNSSWYGVTINYQIDGNKNITPYTVYIDKLKFTAQ
jgi:hypothetical protein